MEWRPFSPIFMLIQLLLVVVFIGANYFYVSWFFGTVEPAAKAATGSAFGVQIERNIMGSWTVPAKHLTDYSGNKLVLQVKVFAVNLLVMLGFIGVILVELILLILLARWAFNSSG